MSEPIHRPSFEPDAAQQLVPPSFEPPVDGTPPPAAREQLCPSVTRRRFLAALGGSVAVAVAGGYGISVWRRGENAPTATLPTGSVPTTLASPPPTTLGPGAPRTLVVIEMGGGNDSLNMIVPHADSAYFNARRGLAIENPIDLDGAIGLHPNLQFLGEQHAAGRLAVVEGVGYPEPDLSHFASMSNWWSGVPQSVGATGWLGRFLDGTVGTDEPLAGVSVGPGPTPALAGEHSFVVAIQDVTGLAPLLPPWIDRTDELLGMWRGYAPAAFDSTKMIDQVRRAIDETVGAATVVNASLAGREPAADRGRRGNDIAQSLLIAASLIVAASPPRVIYIHGWGDFDTHQGQSNRQGTLLADMDAGLRDFFAEIDGFNRDVLVMTTSEFGRRVAFNGSGTDHGTAASQLLIGSAVTAGRYGEAPSLTKLDQRGNMIHTVDYRSLYATVLDGFLEVPAAGVLGNEYEVLPVFG